MRRRSLAMLAAALLASGCVANGADAGQQAAASRTPPATGQDLADGPAAPTESSAPRTTATPLAARRPSEVGANGGAGDPTPKSQDLAMTVTLTPSCVSHGGMLELRVEADEGVQVVWGAVYDGGEGGGDPPLGSGHGGTGSGVVGSEGSYVGSWRVRPSAPIGPAYVIVQAGFGDRYGYREVPFDVVEVTSGCK